MNQNEGRDYADTLVGESLRALYENGWVFIKIMYHNRAFGKYFVQFEILFQIIPTANINTDI